MLESKCLSSEEVISALDKILDNYDNIKSDGENLHVKKRMLYSDVEVLKMNIEDKLLSLAAVSTAGEAESLQKNLKELEDLSSSLNLGYIKRKKYFYDIIDDVVRLLGCLLYTSPSPRD